MWTEGGGRNPSQVPERSCSLAHPLGPHRPSRVAHSWTQAFSSPASLHSLTRCYTVYETRKTMQELPLTCACFERLSPSWFFLAARCRHCAANSSKCGSQEIHHRGLKEGTIFLTANRFSHFLSIQWLKKNVFSCRYELSLWGLWTFFCWWKTHCSLKITNFWSRNDTSSASRDFREIQKPI